jgi:hypothetical protein
LKTSWSSLATTIKHWQTSARVTKSSAERSQTARPSSVANGFFSLSWNRLDRPAAGKMTANVGWLMEIF